MRSRIGLKQGISARLDGRVHIDERWRPIGVTDQFLEDAETYHSRYFHNEYWKYLVSRALEFAQVDPSASLEVLDIGSGSGNSVFAAADLLPRSRIIASDISPQLLKILVKIQERIPSLKNRIEAYCFDLHNDFFADDSFDLIVGGAILHHMLDPEAALKNAARWLRPGGKILLFEPFEIGGHIMAALYLTLIAELELEPDVDARLIAFFKTMCQDYEARFGVPRIKPWSPQLDDKWLFHPSYLREMATNIGLLCEVVRAASDDLWNVFENTIRGTLNVAGLGAVPTPTKLWQVVREFDGGISNVLKRRLAPEGVIVLKKADLAVAERLQSKSS